VRTEDLQVTSQPKRCARETNNDHDP